MKIALSTTITGRIFAFHILINSLFLKKEKNPIIIYLLWLPSFLIISHIITIALHKQEI